MPSDRPFLMFTDIPPLREGGHGCQVLSRNLLEALDGSFGMVITRRTSRQIGREDIYRAPGLRTLVFPDAPWFRPQRLHPWVDFLLFVLSLPWLAVAARRSGCRRIFALFSADAWFLLKVDLLRRATGLPMDVYLVDDLEEIARLTGHRFKSWLARWVEPQVLRRAARVFVISRGFAEHLAQKYYQPAIWLPVYVQATGVTHSPYRPGVPDHRPIVFVGSVNNLYLDSLSLLYQEISRWNRARARPYELRLRVLSRQASPDLLARLPDHDFLDFVLDLDTHALQEQLRAAWAVFLPYSFEPDLRVAVATSFSHKFTESVTAGRPVLVFGPPYASIPRYFREEGLPLCAQSPDELAKVLAEIESHDSPALTDRYGALIQRHHSRDTLHGILDDGIG